MKKITIVLILIITLFSCASTYQKPKHDSKIVSSELIIENLNKTKKDLFLISNDWMIDIFNDAESVIQFTDKEYGTIIGKFLLSGNLTYVYNSPVDTRLFAKIKINIKENRIKINIKPTVAYIYGNDLQIEKTKKDIKNLIISFENHIKSKTKDW